MATSTDERNRILSLVEAGQITAAQAAQLLDTLLAEPERSNIRQPARTVRVWLSDLATTHKKVNVTATVPLSIFRAGLRMLIHLGVPLNEGVVQDVLHAIESGSTGRILDMQDLEEGKRIEIFVE